MDPLGLIDLQKDPDSVLVLTCEKSYTRGGLLGMAAAVGADLKRAGADNSRAIVSFDASPLFIAGMVGCWLAGSVPVLLDPLVRRELVSAVEMTGAKAVLSAAPMVDRLPAGVREIIPGAPAAEPFPAPPPWEEKAPLVFLFTSGSTGKPVLVPKTFANLDVEIRFLASLFENPRRVATLAPWCHIFGLLTSLLVPARLSGTCDLSAGISPKLALERAGRGLLDLVVAVPAVYQVMVRYLESSKPLPIPLSCRFTSSGAPLTARLRARFKELTGRPIIDLYGSTEAGGVAYRFEDGPWLIEPHVEVRIADEGFLEVRSASVSFGEPGSFYRIGDLARPQASGFELFGRSDDVVKIGGRRTAIGEVTEAVEECPGVGSAAVLACEVHGALRLIAFVEPKSGGVDAAAVKSFVRSRLADHKVPRVVRIMERLPRTPAGKIDRRKLVRETVEET
jgi:acyl-CoA synthetase (AMP-forming)/AMP-acid ligase II